MCRACWHPNPIGFVVPDAVWEQAVHPELQHEMLCIGCFARMADERLIRWCDVIELFPVSAAAMVDQGERDA